jgi:hypothetical protein
MNEICRARRKLQRAAAPKERVGLQARKENTRASQDQRRACSSWTIPKKNLRLAQARTEPSSGRRLIRTGPRRRC